VRFRPFVVFAKDRQPSSPFFIFSPLLTITLTHFLVHGAMDNYFSFLQNIWGSNDLTEKMKTYTARNISASTDCMHKLSQAKDFQEAFRIQTEFMQTQLKSFAEQAKSLGEAYTKAATDATKRFGMSA
jgi:Phasin protein